jgi:hypothetical protein
MLEIKIDQKLQNFSYNRNGVTPSGVVNHLG